MKQPRGEALLLHEGPAKQKLLERWAAQRKANAKDPKIGSAPGQSAPLDPSEKADPNQEPIVNQLAQRCVFVHKEKLELLTKRKEVAGRSANKKFPKEDLEAALLACNNDPAAAAKRLIDMGRAEQVPSPHRPLRSPHRLPRVSL